MHGHIHAHTDNPSLQEGQISPLRPGSWPGLPRSDQTHETLQGLNWDWKFSLPLIYHLDSGNSTRLMWNNTCPLLLNQYSSLMIQSKIQLVQVNGYIVKIPPLIDYSEQTCNSLCLSEWNRKRYGPGNEQNVPRNLPRPARHGEVLWVWKLWEHVLL